MHVLLLTISFPNSYNRQSHIFFKDQAKALSNAGIKTGVVSAVSISLLEVIKKRKIDFGLKIYFENNIHIFIYQFPAIPKMFYLTHLIRGCINRYLIKKYIKLNGLPEIVHAHVSFVGAPAIWLKRLHDVPFVVTEHYSTFLKSKFSNWRMRLSKRVFSNSNKNIAVSLNLASALKELFRVDFEFVPNLVDVSFFVPGIKNQANKDGLIKFINIGQLTNNKNQALLINAFTRAFKNNIQFKLTIVGGGVNYSKLNSLITNNGMQGQIELHGQATRSEVLMLLQNSDYFVLSSKFETFGVVIIEAMSCSLPVLSTKSGGPETILVDDRLGLLCENNIENLSKELIELTKRNFDTNSIRNHVLENYSSQKVSGQLKKLYESEILR